MIVNLKEAFAMSELDNQWSLPAGTRRASAGAGLRTVSLKRLRIRENMLAYAFLAPSLLLFGVFLFYPLLRSVYLSLYSTDPAGRVASFVGTENFKALFTSGLFLDGIRVTALFALLTVPSGMLIALVLAALPIIF